LETAKEEQRIGFSPMANSIFQWAGPASRFHTDIGSALGVADFQVGRYIGFGPEYPYPYRRKYIDDEAGSGVDTWEPQSSQEDGGKIALRNYVFTSRMATQPSRDHT
jgi:hypothetical protein